MAKPGADPGEGAVCFGSVLLLLASSLVVVLVRLLRLAAELKLLSLGHTPAWSLSALETLSLHLL